MPSAALTAIYSLLSDSRQYLDCKTARIVAIKLQSGQTLARIVVARRDLRGFTMIVFLMLAFGQSDTLQKIRDAVEENRSLDSLELRYSYDDPKLKFRSPKYSWAFQGIQYAFSYEGNRCFYSGRTGKSWISFDGKTQYQVEHDADGNIREANKQDKAPDRQGKFNYNFARQAETQNIFAWNFGTSDQTFSDLLDSAKLVGEDEVGGHRCFKVDLGINTKDGKPQNRVTAWFDPEVNYWHRKIEIRPFNWKPGQPNRIDRFQRYADYLILEFGQVEDHKTGKKRWFPARCQMEPFPLKRVDIVIEDVRINDDLPLERFIPVVEK
jgi:hypothetical protein